MIHLACKIGGNFLQVQVLGVVDIGDGCGEIGRHALLSFFNVPDEYGVSADHYATRSELMCAIEGPHMSNGISIGLGHLCDISDRQIGYIYIVALEYN